MTASAPTDSPGPPDGEADARPHPDDVAPAPSWVRWVVVGATVLAGVLGAIALGERSFWIDESASVRLVDRSLGDVLWRITHWELNQGPYHLLLWGWAQLVEGDAALRALSVAFAVASVPALYALGRRLVGPTTATLACVLLATHALVVDWGQQVRGYTLALLLCTLSGVALLRAVDRSSAGRIVVYVVVAGLGVYTHFFVGLVVLAQLGSLAVVRPAPRRLLLWAGVPAALVAVPVLAYVLTAEGDTLGWVTRPDLAGLVEAFGALAGGRRPALLVVGALAALGAVAAVRRTLPAPRSPRSWPLVLLLAWAVVPLVVTLVSTYTVQPLFVPRFLIVVLPAVVLLVALGVRSLPARWLQAAAVVVLLVLPVRYLPEQYGREFQDWRGAVELVRAEAQPGDVVVVVPGWATSPLRHYGLGEATTPALVRGGSPEVEGAPRVWVVVLPGSVERGEGSLPAEVAEGRRPAREQDLTGVRVELWVADGAVGAPPSG